MKVVAFPHKPGSGGPGSFQSRFENELKLEGWKIVYAEDKIIPSIIIVVGGTKRLVWLHKMKRKGVPIIYRLDGINWLHRKTRVSVKKYVLAEYRNLNNKIIHAFLTDYVIYQSEFVKRWWDKECIKNVKRFTVIHNGVDLNIFAPMKSHGDISLVCIEGTIDYTPYSLKLLNDLRLLIDKKIEFKLYGNFEDKNNVKKLNETIVYKGVIPLEKVPQVLQNSIFLSLDIHPACPNSVIEALSSGCPVVAFNSGALSELVREKSGIIVPYGSDPWELEYPKVDLLADAVIELYNNYNHYSDNARSLAEKEYDIKLVFKKYNAIMNKLVKSNG